MHSRGETPVIHIHSRSIPNFSRSVTDQNTVMPSFETIYRSRIQRLPGEDQAPIICSRIFGGES